MHLTPEYKKAQKLYLKSTKNRKQVQVEWTPFRAAEKRFTARFPPLDLGGVLDPRQELESVVTVDRLPGLVILPNFLSIQKQKDLIRWSLQKHARQPNETNLDAHYLLPSDGLWNTYLCRSKRDLLIQPKASLNTEQLQVATQSGPRQLVENAPASPEMFHLLSTTPKPPPEPSPTVIPLPVSSMIYKLRWANIGWHYHWGTKQYDFTKGKIEVDDILSQVCKSAVQSVDWGKIFANGWDEEAGEDGKEWEKWDETYEPDAGIVNFYQEKDTLMGHVDKSELCHTSPLVSLSLGTSAIFLIGGLTRDIEPIPILLRSGDVLIMAGPRCRRAFHGVPRILEGSCPNYLTEIDGEDWEPYAEYIKTTRINANVRQVFPKGFDPATYTVPTPPAAQDHNPSPPS